MPRDPEVDCLHDEQEVAFQEKQEAYKCWHDRLSYQEQLYRAKERTRKACDDARVEMNREYEELHRYDSVWDEYKSIKESNNPRITYLKSRADDLAYQMKAAFQRASDAYSYGDKSLAPGYSAEGREYKAQLESLNAEIGELCSEVKAAGDRARAYKRDSSAFHAAKSRFEDAKKEQERAQAELNAYADETKRLKAEFEDAKKRFLRAQERFQERLAAVKGQRQSEEDRLMDQAEIPYYYRKDCKIRREADGTVNFYFGGIGESDGFGHGHVSMDGSGHVTYNRDVFDKHGKENYTDYQERQREYKERHSSFWQVQDDSGDYIVKVKGSYLYDNPHLGKDPSIERTDFILTPKGMPDDYHAHVSVGEDTIEEVKVWHDVEYRPRRRRRSE